MPMGYPPDEIIVKQYQPLQRHQLEHLSCEMWCLLLLFITKLGRTATMGYVGT